MLTGRPRVHRLQSPKLDWGSNQAMSWRLVAACAAVVALLVGCGSTDPAPAPDVGDTTTPTAGPEELDEPMVDPPPDEASPEVGVAVVSLGGRQFEFEMSTNCFEMAGFVAFAGNATDGSDWHFGGGVGGGSGDDDLWMRSAAEDVHWRVDPDAYPASEFIEVAIDGSRASGRVVFAEFLGDTEEGTFEVSCP